MVTHRTCRPISQVAFFMLRMDASAPRKWLGTLTQRRVLYFRVFKEGPGRFLALPTAYVGLWLVGMHHGPRWPAFLFGLQQDSQHTLRITAVLVISLGENLGGILLAWVCSGSCCLRAVRRSLGSQPWELPSPLCHATFAKILWQTHSFQY